MSQAAVAAADIASPRPGTGGGAWPILAGLLAGFAGGLAVRALGGAAAVDAAAFAATVGGLWLDALRMTIIPLIAALIVTSVGGAGAIGGAGRLPARALLLFLVLLLGSAAVSALVAVPIFAGAALKGAALAAAANGVPPIAVPAIPATGDMLRAIIPTNIVAAAAGDRIVSVVVFALLFGAALRQIGEEGRARMLGFFEGLAATMKQLVHWVLRLAPAGVAALAFAVAATTGTATLGPVVRYVAAQWASAIALILMCLALVAASRRVGLDRFVRAALPSQLVAFSTASSLASFPAMVESSAAMRLEPHASGTVLGLAVSLFKITAVSSTIVTMCALAALSGHALSLAQIVIVSLLGVLSSLVIAGVPGSVSYFAVMIPAANAAGIPIALLPLLLAIDPIADMMRTAANVTADLAAAALLAPGETN